MATDTKIANLTAITGANLDRINDLIVVEDTSVPQTKRMTPAEFLTPITISGGNIGMGTTAIPVGTSSQIHLNIGPDANIMGERSGAVNNSLSLSQNASFNSSIWKYIETDAASNYYQASGGHVWRVAASGTAGNTVTWTEALKITNAALVGIGMTPTTQFQISVDGATKPATNTWTIASDERLKENIVAADLKRCYEIVKLLPLKRYTWKNEVYSDKEVADRSKLGWIAQDVQPVFAHAVSTVNHLLRPVDDGVEEFDEQETINEDVEEKFIELVDGVAVQKIKIAKRSTQVMDELPVVDENGNAVFVATRIAERGADGNVVEKIVNVPAMHKVPRTHKSTRPRTCQPVIENCLNLNSDQIYAAMYGALQFLMQKVEALEKKQGK